MSTQPRRPIRLLLSAVTTFAVAGALAFAGAGVARADDPPANPLSAAPIQATTKQGQPVTVTLQGSGPTGDQLSYLVGSGGFGPVTTAHGSVVTDFFPSTHATYTPAPGFSGTDTFTYTVQDNALFGQSASATVTITVTPVSPDNHAPVALPITVSVENPPVDGFPATATDADGDILAFAVATPPSHGTVSLGRNQSGATFFYYEPTGDYTGPDSFTFTASDGVLTSAPATVSITVVPQRANTPPTSVPPPTVVTAQDTAVAIALTGSDADGDAIQFFYEGDAKHGTVVDNGNGHLTYTPALGYSGADTFHYNLSDGRSTSADYAVNITITPATVGAHTPTVRAFSVTSTGGPVPVTLLGSDPDGDALTYAISGGPSHGVLSGTGANLTYTPGSFTGSDSFTYTASDGTHVSAPALVQITVVPPFVPVDPSLDVSVSADQKKAASQIVSPKLSTTGADRLVLAFVSVDGPASSTASGAQSVASVSGGGLSWSLVKRSNATWGTAEVWQAHATSLLTGVAVTAKFSKSGYDGSITVATFANSTGTVGSSVAASGKTGAPSASVVTPSDSSSQLVWAVGHDWSRAITPIPVTDLDMAHVFVDTRVGDTFWTEHSGSALGGGGFTFPVGVSSPTVDRWQLVAVTIPGVAPTPLTPPVAN